MKWFSMFSGIGGFELGLLQAGHEVVAGCEIDEYARSIYAKHFPKTRLYRDATKLNPEELPDIDGIAGGFPCQAFSICGDRKGFDETRGTLFFEILRIAKVKKPRVLFLENVRGLLSHDNGRTFEVMLKALDELGYDAQWQVLNSKYFIPQNRERIFIIATLRGHSRPEIFPIGEIKTVDNKESGKSEEPIINCIDASYYKGTDKHGQRTMIVLAQNEMQQYRVYDPSGISATLCANGGGVGAKTGLYLVDKDIRRLTPLECERLQGFPDNWTYGLSDTQRYKCIGNAVTVQVIEWIARRLT